MRAPARQRRAPLVLACACACLGGALGAAGAACDGGRRPDARPASSDAAVAPRRWPRPPSSEVRAYPPHAIRSDRVGPYLIDAPLSDVLRSLPEGPRVEILQVGGLLDWRVVRAEQGGLIIGADRRNRVAFVAVLTAEVARTGAGVGVGDTGAALLAALGPELDAGDVVWDRRVFEFASLPGVRFLTDAAVDAPPERARVVAALVARPRLFERVGEAAPPADAPRLVPDAGAPPRAPGGCRRGADPPGLIDEIALVARGRTARLAAPTAGRAGLPLVRFGCFTSATREAVAVGPGEIAIVGGEAGKLRRLYHGPLDEAHFVGPVDVEGDGRDELIVGVQHYQAAQRVVEIRVFRWEAGRLTEAASARPFAVSAAAAASAGAAPADVDLLVRVQAVEGALAVGGVYLARAGGVVRDVVPVPPVPMSVDWRRAPGVTTFAEGGGIAPDAAGRDRGPRGGPDGGEPNAGAARPVEAGPP